MRKGKWEIEKWRKKIGNNALIINSAREKGGGRVGEKKKNKSLLATRCAFFTAVTKGRQQVCG